VVIEQLDKSFGVDVVNINMTAEEFIRLSNIVSRYCYIHGDDKDIRTQLLNADVVPYDELGE